MTGKISIAVVGMGFGAEFAAIYNRHPAVERCIVVDQSAERLGAVADRFDIAERRTSLDDVLADPSIDAVHIATGIPDHAAQTLETLSAGKHCACAVPMATTIDDLHRILAAVDSSGCCYMMMETTVYDRAFLWVQAQHEAGRFGEIQMLRGAHYQDMENWPPYWAGLPPMWYATHAVSPPLALADTRVEAVHCFGSGRMRRDLEVHYENPFPIETALFELEGTPAVLEVTRALFHSARPYIESFNVYGSDATFEWQQHHAELPVIFDLSPLGEGDGPRRTSSTRIELPDFADRLPGEIARFTRRGVYDDSVPHLSFTHGGGHGGSHPHLCHEFVSAIVEGRKPMIDEIRGADWTAPGICAHESALRGGVRIEVPRFRAP